MPIAFIAAVLAILVLSSHALAAEQRGTMTITFKYQSVVVRPVEDFDGVWEHKTVVDQTASMTCPVFNDGVSPTSYLDGLNPQQKKAQAAVGKATEADAAEMQNEGAVAKMQDLEAMMKACKARGGSDETCAMEVMKAMQGDPALLEGGAKAGARSKAAAPKLDAAAGRFEIWFSENCTGTLTANNRTTLSKGGVTKNVETIVGKRPSSIVDANIVVETDLAKKSSRVWIVAPEASGLQRTAPDNKNEATLAALPDANVLSGPTPGGIKSGRYSKTIPGGGYDVEWAFAGGK
jgi:hypothetical protein